METAVQTFAIINLLIIGLSHIARPHAWVVFFDGLRAKGETGVFIVAFISLGFGSIIAAFHPVWSGLPLLLTILGWSQVLKALIYFLRPAYGLRKLQMVSHERARLLMLPGVVFVLIALVLFYDLVR